jgi:transposase
VSYQRRLANHLPEILEALAPYQADVSGVVVESTYNWYWLVDGLMEAGYRVHLANPAAMQQYSGLKYTNDHSDARWLAHLLRLDVCFISSLPVVPRLPCKAWADKRPVQIVWAVR